MSPRPTTGFPRESHGAGRVNWQIGPTIDYQFISMRQKERFSLTFPLSAEEAAKQKPVFRKSKGTTKQWSVENKRSGGIIGGVRWERGWRQYCFFPKGDTVFSTGCLLDIVDFIDRQMTEWRASRGKD